MFFDPWQQGLNTVTLGCRKDGKYAATVGGVQASIPRQVGKTYDYGNLLIGLCLEFPDLRAVWTSHHNRTTTNTFRSMCAMVRRKKIAPHLAPNGIRTANGEQEIRFRNGSIIMFGAREQGFGRGMDAIDILVFDEAQILGIKALEDMVPATNQARHPHGALVIFIGTPPRPTDPGEAFTSKRERAISGKSTDQLYVELSADPDADSDDRSQWALMNPSFPHRTPLESMLRMRENIPDEESWRREAMGIWPINGGGLITEEMWAALKDPQSVSLDPVSFGVYANKGQTAAAIAMAGYRSDGKIHVEIIPVATDQPDTRMRPGLKWIPPRVKELVTRWAPCAVMVDERSEAGAVIEDLQALGVEVHTTNATGMANACSKFLSVVKEDGLRHCGAKDLQKSVCAGKKRDLADAWAWDRKDATSDITQLVAVTLALHGLIVHGRVQETQVWGFYS
ncbi:terminase [Mycobacteroides saopaulense]|uniref:terminase n=1 Tax=Mycobacteroides saopaulense TaxID=1578165 RepID=UPI000A7CAFA6|nr:terminase [Mycobacteroides saopaulense]